MKLLQDDNGNTSTLRAIVLPTAWLGLLVTINGVIGMYLELSAAPAVLIAGPALTATAVGAKAWQKHSEAK
tara:strand:+ start:94 stop:306 length:213 start_codon:yes stop_codon:yes gene_type:complete